MSDFKYDLAIVGGCGHVGLPLGISFANEGLKVVGIDIDEDRLSKVMRKELPFMEKGAKELLNKVVDNKSFFVTKQIGYVKDAKYIVITTGTPVDSDHTPDLSQIENVINDIMPLLREEQCIILRSTVAPKTTDHVKFYIERNTNFKIGKDLFLIFSPERIVQGEAIEELKKLPEIIGAYDDKGFDKAKELFSLLSPKIIRTTPIEAELCKLFTNTYRYVNFALANEYYVIADSFGANIHKIINAINEDYPRANIPKVGFTKGPCLGKDSLLLTNTVHHLTSSTGIVSSAFRVNEGFPTFLLGKIKEKVNLNGKKVAVLGLTFKRDSDDTRDSLSLKFLKLLRVEFIKYETHDPYVDNKDLEGVIKDADIIVIAVNHSAYGNIDFSKIAKKSAIMVDMWNMFNKNELIYEL